MLTNAMVMATTQAMVLAMAWRVTKWAWQGQQGQSSPTPLPLLLSSLPLLSWQPSLLLLPPPQLPNTIALSAAIAVDVAIAHLFGAATKLQLRGQWQWKQLPRQQGWRASNGDNCDGNRDNTCDGDGNKVAGDKEGDGKSSKSNEDGNKDAMVMAARAMVMATKRTRRAMSMMARAMATATNRAMARVARAMAMAKKKAMALVARLMAIATKRAMVRAGRGLVMMTRVAGNKEGNGDSGKSDGNCNKEGKGKGKGGKRDGNGNKEGNGNRWRGQCQ
jgi:hypothetical protein